MATKKAAPRMIRTCNSHKELLEFWNKLQQGQIPDQQSGKPFEDLVLRAYEIEEAKVAWPFEVKSTSSSQTIEQIDGAVYTDGLFCLLECKSWSENVDVVPIAKLRNQLMRRPAGVIGAVFAGKDFTSAAQELALYIAPQTILLWDGSDVTFALEKGCMRRGLFAKYQYAAEHALPYGPLSVLLKDDFK